MRLFMRATTVAALCLFSGTTVALADGWGDNTTYRNLSWSGSTPDVRRSSESGSVRQAQPQRRTRVVEANDEDRPQRRSRTARVERASPVDRGSVASGSGSGGTTGVASYYWQPQRVASGGWFNPNAMTAAHKTLPFGTRVRVTHVGNGRSVDVTINDRGPYIAGRIIDLSRAAASAINMTGQGVAQIRMTVLGR
ncbi:MAG: septal ring lytic transglycosylase RlpA family protein [Hyphomicrobiaceae bacterium]